MSTGRKTVAPLDSDRRSWPLTGSAAFLTMNFPEIVRECGRNMGESYHLLTKGVVLGELSGIPEYRTAFFRL